MITRGRILFFITLCLIVLGKITGFLKDISLTYYFGVTWLTDALFLALTISSLLYISLYNTINTDFISVYDNYLKKQEISTLLGALIIYLSLSLILSIFTLVFSEDIVAIFYDGQHAELIKESSAYLKVMALSYPLSSLVIILNTRLIYKGKPLLFYITAVVNNVFFTLGVFLFFEDNSFASVLYFGILSWSLLLFLVFSFSNIPLQYIFKFLNVKPEFKNLKNIISSLVYMLSDSIVLIYIISKLSTLDSGSISYFNLGNKLVGFFLSFFLLITTTHLAPYIVKKFRADNYKLKLIKFLFYYIILAFPLTLLLSHNSCFISETVFSRGKITSDDIKNISVFFAFLIWLFPILLLKDIIFRLSSNLGWTRSNLLSSFFLILIIFLGGEFFFNGSASNLMLIYIFACFVQCFYMVYSLLNSNSR